MSAFVLRWFFINRLSRSELPFQSKLYIAIINYLSDICKQFFLFTYRVNSGSLARKLCRQFITLALRRIKQLYQIVRALQSIEPLRSRFWLNIRSGSDSAISCQLHTLGGIVGMVTICTVYQTYFRLASKINMQASPYHHARVKPFEPPKFNINYQKILQSVANVKQGNTFLQRSLLTTTRPSDRPEEEVSEQKTVLENGLQFD